MPSAMAALLAAHRCGPVALPRARCPPQAFTPRNPNQVVLDQPFKREFTVGPLPEDQARQCLCSGTSALPTGAGLEYFGVVLTFRVDGGGALGLLWVREEGKWRIVSFQPLNQ